MTIDRNQAAFTLGDLLRLLDLAGRSKFDNLCWFGSALFKTGMSVKADNSRICSGELEQTPDIASGFKLYFSSSIFNPLPL